MHIVQSLERLCLHLSLLPLSGESFSSLGTWCLVLHAHPIPWAPQPFVHFPPGCALPRHLLSKFGAAAACCTGSIEGGAESQVDEPCFWDQKGPWPPVLRAFVSLGITVLKTTEEKGAYIPSGREQWGLEFRNPGETPKHCLGYMSLSAPGEAWIYTGKLPPAQLLLPWAPRFLSLSIYFLVYNFFPCIKGIFL